MSWIWAGALFPLRELQRAGTSCVLSRCSYVSCLEDTRHVAGCAGVRARKQLALFRLPYQAPRVWNSAHSRAFRNNTLCLQKRWHL